MKSAIYFLVLLPFLATGQSATPTGNSAELMAAGSKLYLLEKGIIHYETDGQPHDTLVFVFDRYGWRQTTAEFGEKVYYGMKTHINTREIHDGLTIYTINLKDKKGKHVTDNALAKMASYKNHEDLLVAQMAKLGAVRTERAATHLDRTCVVWEYVDKTHTYEIWTWQGLILKKQAHKGSITATQINTESAINEAWFTVPGDVHWQ